MGVEMVAIAHRLTSELGEAGRLALTAGVDAELPRTAAFGPPLVAALEAGRVEETMLDDTVRRVLRMKFRLGLFDRPYVETPAESAIAALVADEARAGRTLAARARVLVE